VRNPFAPLFALKSIGSPYELAQYLLKGLDTTAGARVSEATALNLAAVMTCVSLRSRALASLPFGVFERIDERSRKLARHSINRVLSQPNSWQTRAELFGMLEAHRVLRGNAYAWKNIIALGNGPDGRFERNQITELIPMHPDQVELLDDFDEFGAPRTYRLHRRKSPPVDLPAAEVLHLKGLSTDGRSGRSVLADAREMLGVALATQEHAASFWSRDATPTVAIKHPRPLSDKARKNLEESFEAIYGRGKDKRRTAVLEEGMEITPISVNANDAQFLETRKFQRSEIAGWFHVPPHMIGDTDKTTSWGTGIEQQQIGFVTFTLAPDLVCWEQRLGMDLLNASDRERFFFKFNANALLRADVANRGMFYRVMREVGAFSANDIRALEDMNPIPGADGDSYLQPTNLAPLGSNPLAATTNGAS
jgi:HK97 family phage portal protein